VFGYVRIVDETLIRTLKDDSDRHGMDASVQDMLDLNEVGGVPPLEISPSAKVVDNHILRKVHSQFAQQTSQFQGLRSSLTIQHTF
jgi:hypothetical protein